MLKPQTSRTRSVQDLSGLWQFQIDPDVSGESAGWTTHLPDSRPIAVPGSWNEQFPELDQYLDLAWYETTTFVPVSWVDQQVHLWVGSANYAARVWVNGEFLGEHQGGHLPFSFDVSQALRYGDENTIAISVDNTLKPDRVPPGNLEAESPMGFSSNIPAANFDFFPYAGLHRQVALIAVPVAHIADITVVTGIDGSSGTVDLELDVSENWSGIATATFSLDGDTHTAELSVAEGKASGSIEVPNAKLWSPDEPNLYRLDVEIRSGDELLDHTWLNIGIRTFVVDGHKLLLNGEPVFLKGFGKHEDSPAIGRGINLPLHRQDASLLKWIGANSYRTSHYPYAEEALDIADREGFLIINEIPAVGLSFNDGEENIRARLDQCRLQIEELIARDKNHPSVVAWSIANEPVPNNMSGLQALDESESEGDASGGNAFFEELAAHTRALDSTRPITIVGLMGGSPTDWMALSDFVSINRYYGWYIQGYDLKTARASLEAELDALYEKHGKPIAITEFGADTIAGRHSVDPQFFSEEYQSDVIAMYLDVADERDYMAGMHIWNFADFRTAQGVMRMGGFNLKGVFTRDRQPKKAAFMLRDRWTS